MTIVIRTHLERDYFFLILRAVLPPPVGINDGCMKNLYSQPTCQRKSNRIKLQIGKLYFN